MKVIILDRDGVINYDSDAYIKSPEEWQPIPGSLETIAQLNQGGYKVFVVTNQSGVGRGYYTVDVLEEIHEKMKQALNQIGGKIEKIYYCIHAPEENCNCRKPNTGMFEQIKKDYSIDLKEVFYIGDKYRDYQAAENVGCRFILVLTGYGQETLVNHPELENKISISKNLQEAVKQYIL